MNRFIVVSLRYKNDILQSRYKHFLALKFPTISSPTHLGETQFNFQSKFFWDMLLIIPEMLQECQNIGIYV